MTQRHCTATAFVFNGKGQTLLLWHRRFRRWMPPGGHVDPHELPHEAALRECLEETGLHVAIEEEKKTDVFAENHSEGRMLPLPRMLLLENIPESKERGESEHEHMDFVYITRPTDEAEVLRIAQDEATHLAWFTISEVEALGADELFANVRAILRSLMAEKGSL